MLAVTTTEVKGGVVEGTSGGPQLAKDNDKHRDNAARTLRNVDVSVCYVVVPAQSTRAGVRVLFIGTQFSILYTSMYSPAVGTDPLTPSCFAGQIARRNEFRRRQEVALIKDRIAKAQYAIRIDAPSRSRPHHCDAGMHAISMRLFAYTYP